MKTHKLKTWPVYFDRLVLGDKTFELRKNDRDFQTGDDVYLLEYNPDNGLYTGRELTFRISYILHGGSFGVEPGYCVLSLSRIQP